MTHRLPCRAHCLAAALLWAAVAGGVAPAARAASPEEEVAARAQVLRDAGWTLAHGRPDLQVLTRGVPGTDVREVTAIATAPAPPARLMAVVTDFRHYTDFIPYLVQCEVLPSPDGVTRIAQRFDFPPPISDRLFTVRLSPPRTDPDGRTWLSWTLETDPVFQRGTGGVRPPVLEGNWTFTPLGAGRPTLAVFQVRADPGGWMPRWAVDLALRRTVPKVVDEVARRAAEP